MSKCKLHGKEGNCVKCNANVRAKKYRQGKGRETRQKYEEKWLVNGGKEIRRKSLAKYRKKKYNTDMEYRMIHIQRQRISDFIGADSKSKNTLELIGCTPSELLSHLESQFDKKMTWDNYGTYWQVDHKYPLSIAMKDSVVEFEKACHYTNMQPLEAMENLRKSNKI